VLDKPVPIGYVSGWIAVVVVWFGFPLAAKIVFVAGTECSTWFLLESLILAQDERWRRA
jgi:hypothetical protein